MAKKYTFLSPTPSLHINYSHTQKKKKRCVEVICFTSMNHAGWFQVIYILSVPLFFVTHVLLSTSAHTNEFPCAPNAPSTAANHSHSLRVLLVGSNCFFLQTISLCNQLPRGCTSITRISTCLSLRLTFSFSYLQKLPLISRSPQNWYYVNLTV